MVTVTNAQLAVPAINEPFTLEVDYDVNPREVIDDCFTQPYAQRWEYLGPKRSGKRIMPAKLVYLPPAQDLKKVMRAADKMGYYLLEAQAQEAFRRKYLASTSKEFQILFGNSVWDNNDWSDLTCITYLAAIGSEWYTFNRPLIAYNSNEFCWAISGK